MGQSERAIEGERATCGAESRVLHEHHKSIWVHVLLRHPRRDRRSDGEPAHRKCNIVQGGVTLIIHTTIVHYRALVEERKEEWHCGRQGKQKNG